jgi:glycosyltransferase involved in cell wall biosynthesis
MFSTIDLREFDLVISSSYNFAHHVFTGPNTAHVCYCHSPSRFLWDFEDYAEKEGFGFFLRAFISSQLTELRALDRSAAQGVDRWVSTSRLVQNRIKKFYRRRSVILPPSINIDEFHISEKPEDYFLLLMRLVPWKRADIAIQACSKLGLPLVVAGDGRDYSRLKTIAGPSVRFVGRMDGQDKADLYSNCCAFIIPSIEDFGITPLEAMASGRPVIALGQGGALDTVLPGTTGEFFVSQSVESLVEILRSFDPSNYDSIAIREYAKSFDTLQFRDSMRHISAKALGERCVSKLVNQK